MTRLQFQEVVLRQIIVLLQAALRHHVTRVTSDPVYSYTVKFINPNKKSDVATFYLHYFRAAFVSLRVKLIEVFKDRVPSTLDFNIGYFEGSQQAKIWLVTTDNLNNLYQKFPKGGQITLWCDG